MTTPEFYQTSSRQFGVPSDEFTNPAFHTMAAKKEDPYVNSKAPTKLYQFGTSNATAADNFMKDRKLEPGEQMAKIIKDDKIYVIILKEFRAPSTDVDQNAVEEEKEKPKKTVRTNIYTPEELEKIKIRLPQMEKPQLKKIEEDLLKQPKTANEKGWQDPKTGQLLSMVRKTIEQRESNVEKIRRQRQGGTRKRKMRSKKTLRHK